MSRLFLCVGLVLLMTSACGGGSSSRSDSTQSPAAPTIELDAPFTVEGPYPADANLAALRVMNNGNERAILDVTKREVWVVRPARTLSGAGFRSIALSWLDSATIAIDSGGNRFTWRVGGAIVASPSGLSPLPAPQAYVTEEPSSDGSWYARMEQTPEYIDTLVGRHGDDPMFRIVRTAGARWSPTDSTRLAVLGNPCIWPDIFDVLLFDTTTAALRNVTTDLRGTGANFLWRPDGQTIAVEVWPDADGVSHIALIDVLTGEIDKLPLGLTQGPVPISWSGDGRYLIVRIEGGHGGLLCERQSDWQPSVVELPTP